MRVLDLFSGIGGFSLGLERAGPFRTVAFCEREPFPQAVLKKHWPEVPIYDDVRTIPTDELGRIDLICGGFPCQPWSVAGQQRGAEDDRDLWPVMASLIEKLRPQWVIGENVRGFVNESLGLKRSLSDLESIGYQAAPFIIPACAVGAPHRRDRVWILGYSENKRREKRENFRRPRAENKQNKRPSFWGESGGSSKDVAHAGRHATRPREEMDGDTAKRSQGIFNATNSREDVADTYGAHVEGQWVTKRIQTKRSATSSASRWLPEPDVGRVAHGVPRRVDRLKALGNAIVPQIAEEIGHAIVAATKGEDYGRI
jgi:DNA (cytosine-5)-methyltransferase 1